jgi:hypothetical protein
MIAIICALEISGRKTIRKLSNFRFFLVNFAMFNLKREYGEKACIIYLSGDQSFFGQD